MPIGNCYFNPSLRAWDDFVLDRELDGKLFICIAHQCQIQRWTYYYILAVYANNLKEVFELYLSDFDSHETVYIFRGIRVECIVQHNKVTNGPADLVGYEIKRNKETTRPCVV